MPPKEKSQRFIRSVKLTGIQKRYLPNKHYVYIFKVKWSDGTGHVIYRSYSDFFEFHTELVDLFPLEAGLLSDKDRVIPNFPRRKFYEKNEMCQFARQQQVQFEQYCNQLINMKSPIAKHPFLLLFFQPKFEDLEPSQVVLKKPKKVSKLKKMMEKFSKRKKMRRRSSFGHPSDHPLGAMAEQYKALNGFEAEVDGQVSFKKGDVLKVLERNASGWWIAEVPNGEYGWVPGSILEKHGDMEFEEAINIAGELHISVQSYTAQNEDELSFDAGVTLMVLQKRMTGWWIGRYDGSVGYVPSAYLVKYTNEDYLRVCTPILPLRPKDPISYSVTPVFCRSPSGFAEKLRLSPRSNDSLMEARSEEDALELARTLSALHLQSLSIHKDFNNNSSSWNDPEYVFNTPAARSDQGPSSEAVKKPIMIPEIIITRPDDDPEDETTETPDKQGNEAQDSDGSMKPGGTTHVDPIKKMAACFADNDYQKFMTKDTNLNQEAPKDKVSAKRSPFCLAETNNKDSVVSTGSLERKTGRNKLKLTHDNELSGSCPSQDFCKSATPETGDSFQNRKVDAKCSCTPHAQILSSVICSKHSSMETPNLSCSCQTWNESALGLSLSSSRLLGDFVSHCGLHDLSTVVCPNSTPKQDLEMRFQVSKLKRTPFKILGDQVGPLPYTNVNFESVLEGIFETNVQSSTPAACALSDLPSKFTLATCSGTPYFASSIQGKSANVTDSWYISATCNESSVFLQDPTPVKLFSIKPRAPSPNRKFIDSPRTACKLNWVIFEDEEQTVPQNDNNLDINKMPVYEEKENEFIPWGKTQPTESTAYPRTPEPNTSWSCGQCDSIPSDPFVSPGSQAAISQLVVAIQNLADVIAKGLPNQTRIVVKDVAQQCDICDISPEDSGESFEV